MGTARSSAATSAISSGDSPTGRRWRAGCTVGERIAYHRRRARSDGREGIGTAPNVVPEIQAAMLR
ncbi:hypothetical protein [Nocardia sp. NRRL S-836]|uniref:hypothetical protein n=1 Tax=Nocardia sp. NRRL S-836 TaxID=1519492 RepID=UPI0006B02896|nr:hypothetical protein [Nocardia sp. NRRL S-836]KOV84471.1 hypothetical protein ADL03_16365 [Nocardia sp. NRRL S-836]